MNNRVMIVWSLGIMGLFQQFPLHAQYVGSLTAGLAVQTGHENIATEIDLYDQQQTEAFLVNGRLAQWLGFLSRQPQEQRQMLKQLSQKFAVAHVIVYNRSPKTIYVKANNYLRGFEGAEITAQTVSKAYPATAIFLTVSAVATMLLTARALHQWYSSPRGVIAGSWHQISTLWTALGNVVQSPNMAQAQALGSDLLAKLMILSPLIMAWLTYNISAINDVTHLISNPSSIRKESYEGQERSVTPVNEHFEIKPGEQLEEWIFIDKSKGVVTPAVLASLKLMWTFEPPAVPAPVVAA